MEKSIALKTWEVQAILEGRKTQKRIAARSIPSIATRVEKIATDKFAWYYGSQDKSIEPHYQVGDILWTKETWCRGHAENGDNKTIYKADIETDLQAMHIWKPSIHMPRKYARLFLKVTDVRVERLQDITEVDANKEGFEDGPCLESLELFESVWKEIYGNWDDNPWVWVIEFE